MPGNLNLKKSWHPGLMKNQKKLWEQEQEALQEHQKIKEREKELSAEREKQALLKLQYGDDIPTEKKRELSNLNWMYEDAPKETTVDGFREVNEEFTDGKKQVEDMLSGKQAIETKVVSRMERIVGGTGLNKSVRLADDPLLKIKDQEIKRLKQDRHGSRSHHDHKRHRLHRRDKVDKPGRKERNERPEVAQRLLKPLVNY